MSILLISRVTAPPIQRVGWLGIALLFVTCLPMLYVGVLVARKKVDGFYICGTVQPADAAPGELLELFSWICPSAGHRMRRRL